MLTPIFFHHNHSRYKAQAANMLELDYVCVMQLCCASALTRSRLVMLGLTRVGMQ